MHSLLPAELLHTLVGGSRIWAIFSLLYNFFFIDLSLPLERSHNFRWYDLGSSGQGHNCPIIVLA
jgi:hypothetical protein